jgi:hypothetical protein
MELEWWALWGLLGAFVYAAPRLVVAIGEAQAVGRSAFRQLAEFLVALAFGPIFSVGFGPWAAHWLEKEGHPETRALALVIGMVANPLAPALVKVATGEILRRAGGASRGDQKE